MHMTPLVPTHSRTHTYPCTRDFLCTGCRFDPDAASLGKCPVCMTGRPGCPRCFMLPKRRNGDDTKPSDYEFDPEKDELARLAHLPLSPLLAITPHTNLLD